MFVCKFFPWAIFAYHIPLIRKTTGLFKHTDIHVATRATNTLFNNFLTLKKQKTNFKQAESTNQHEKRVKIHI